MPPTGRSSAKSSPSSPTCGSEGSWRIERVTGLATDTTAGAASAATTSTGAEAEDLAAPLYVAWQITNECNLACLHCIEESGPGKAFADELDAAQIFAILDQLMDHDVPSL